MLIRSLIAAALFGVQAASAAGELLVVSEAKAPNGETIQLHDTTGPCVDGARQATWVSADATERVPGCFKANLVSRIVRIAWLDGDSHKIPLDAFSKPEGI